MEKARRAAGLPVSTPLFSEQRSRSARTTTRAHYRRQRCCSSNQRSRPTTGSPWSGRPLDLTRSARSARAHESDRTASPVRLRIPHPALCEIFGSSSTACQRTPRRGVGFDRNARGSADGRVGARSSASGARQVATMNHDREPPATTRKNPGPAGRAPSCPSRTDRSRRARFAGGAPGSAGARPVAGARSARGGGWGRYVPCEGVCPQGGRSKRVRCRRPLSRRDPASAFSSLDRGQAQHMDAAAVTIFVIAVGIVFVIALREFGRNR